MKKLKKLSEKVVKAFVDYSFGKGKHGDIKFYEGKAYVLRLKSQYNGWYSALTGKKLTNVYGVDIELNA